MNYGYLNLGGKVIVSSDDDLLREMEETDKLDDILNLENEIELIDEVKKGIKEKTPNLANMYKSLIKCYLSSAVTITVALGLVFFNGITLYNLLVALIPSLLVASSLIIPHEIYKRKAIKVAKGCELSIDFLEKRKEKCEKELEHIKSIAKKEEDMIVNAPRKCQLEAQSTLKNIEDEVNLFMDLGYDYELFKKLYDEQNLDNLKMLFPDEIGKVEMYFDEDEQKLTRKKK